MPSSFPSARYAPALMVRQHLFSLLTEDGELLTLSASEACRHLRTMTPPLVVNAPDTLSELGLRTSEQPFPCFDLLELYTFVYPARPVVPTPRGLAIALGHEPDDIPSEEADLLHTLLSQILADLETLSNGPQAEFLNALTIRLGQAEWPWASTVAECIRLNSRLTSSGKLPDDAMQPADALRIWHKLPKWEEAAPRPPASAYPITAAEARTRLAALLGETAENRAGQADFSSVSTIAFTPATHAASPSIVLAEAGTGTGKTLGYLAPASLWTERNDGTVWISTYTRHLQRQIEQETKRIFPDEATRRRHVVLRKGRENYMCLLNMEDVVNSAASRPARLTVALAMLARWAMASADGDLTGGDLPGWFGSIFGHNITSAVADRRGECIHGACAHYQRCFVEHTIRRAREADLVIANHALVMAQVAYARHDGDATEETPQEETIPSHYIFDEGHHLSDAADGAFSAELSGLEAAELRRWLLGAEGNRSRARGLKRRLDDLVSGHKKLEAQLDAALMAAHALPAPGWSVRLNESETTQEKTDTPEEADTTPPAPKLENPTEVFLRLIRQQVMARNQTDQSYGTIECDLHPSLPELTHASHTLAHAYMQLAQPLRALASALSCRLQDEADTLDSTTRGRIEAMVRSLQRRAITRVEAWISMLETFDQPAREPGTMPEHVHFLRLTRRGKQHLIEQDVGLHRHWLDPTIPFAGIMALPAQGLLITSATLRDRSESAAPPASSTPAQAEFDTEEAERSWAAAEALTGVCHFPAPAVRASLSSPFDYASQTRTFIINDLDHNNLHDLSAAFRTLFTASGGGGLGLFTAISRLRGVHSHIATPLREQNIPLYAQHVNALDNATLIDIFRTEENACLLGTDAMRDGVDVPGRALRLVVFERVPWPRPDILHRERRVHLSGGDPKGYDDSIARMKLRQAFGRLIRSQSDRGVFVLLDRRTPSRLLSAFPHGVSPERRGLAKAAEEIRSFLLPKD